MNKSMGKEMGYEITTHQMQYDIADKERDQKINAEYTLEGVILQNVEMEYTC